MEGFTSNGYFAIYMYAIEELLQPEYRSVVLLPRF